MVTTGMTSTLFSCSVRVFAVTFVTLVLLLRGEVRVWTILVDGERIVAMLRRSKARFSSLVSVHGVAYFVLSFL